MEFKLSDNQKFNMIWTLLNPRFTEEDGYYMDYMICDIYDEYALTFNLNDNCYERVYYTKDDASDSLVLGEKEVAYVIDVNEEEKKALDMLHALHNNTYEKIDEYVTDLENKNLESDSKIKEYEVSVSTLQSEKEKAEELYTELKNEYDASIVKVEELTTENEQLASYKAAAELAKKENILEKYAVQLDTEVIDSFRESLDNYTEEALEKELAFTLVQSKPAIFTTEEKVPKIVPKEDTPKGGLAEILSRYKK